MRILSNGLATLGFLFLLQGEGVKAAEVDDNKALVKTFFALFDTGKIDEAFENVSEDVNWWVPNPPAVKGDKTKSEYMAIVRSIQKGFPEGLALKLTSMVAERDLVAAEVESLGKHVNGRTYNNKYHFLIKIKAGKIVSVKEYMDTYHLYALLLPPEKN